jgi:hypothetical protein
MQTRTTLPSGHELQINKVELDAAAALLEIVSAELARADKRLSEKLILAVLAKDKAALMEALGGQDVDMFLSLVFRFLANRDIRLAVLECMKKWILCGEAATWKAFEPEDRRGDLIPCALEVARYALLPFFANLGLKSSAPTEPTNDSPT